MIRLFERGATVFTAGYDRNTPLHLAALKGFTTIGKKFIHSGAFIHAKNRNGQTPLEISIANSHSEFSVMMIKAMQPRRYTHCNNINTYKIAVHVTVQGLSKHIVKLVSDLFCRVRELFQGKGNTPSKLGLHTLLDTPSMKVLINAKIEPINKCGFYKGVTVST